MKKTRAMMRLAALAAMCGTVLGTEFKLPEGVRVVWDLSKTHRETTPTRERVSINGLWRWQPAEGSEAAPPSAGWGYLRVPESWPGGSTRDGGGVQIFFPQPGWDLRKLGALTAAWYQREISVPARWDGCRITLSAEHVNSYAAVFLDGAKVGELRYPAGELDLTRLCRPGRTQVLSLLVLALPLKAVMLSFNDTAAARQIEGRVARKGLCGDVHLNAMPQGARLDDVRVETSVRRWEIVLDAAFTALDPKLSYNLRAEIRDGSRIVKSFLTGAFTAGALSGGRIRVSEFWKPEKLWDTITPGNQYEIAVSLLQGGKLLDAAPPIRFGFREFWIDGRDFYLNGSRIYLSAIPIDNGIGNSTQASYEAARATLQRFKSFGINFVYTHNYGCEPGSHFPYHEILRAADDEGVLVSFSQPHFGHYDWAADDAGAANGYAQHAQFYIRVAQNHPSVVFYSTSHNATGYSEDMNPDMIDGIQNPREQWALRNAQRAARAEAILRRLDASRIVYHHSSGNLGSMHTSNFYANWAPIQEMSDWFEHWATRGVKPLFTCEYSVPFLWDWSMYRGWYKGKREFGSASVPWEFCNAEWNAQFFGDAAYRIREEEKVNLRWEAARFRQGRTWQRWDYPHNLNTQVFEERFHIIARYLTDNWRAFRTWGMSANSPWEYGSYWKTLPAEAEAPLEVDWDKLQRPGPRPVYVREDLAKERLAFKPSRYEPTPAAVALERNNRPLLAYIAGRPAAFTSKDHNFLPGETVEKQVIVINNSRRAVRFECEWSCGLPAPAKGRVSGALPTGEQTRIPLRIELPAALQPGRYSLRARVTFDKDEVQEDTFSISVLPPPAKPRLNARIALFDPVGETAKLLERLGVPWKPVSAKDDLAGFDILIAGKGALAPERPAPDIARVRGGLKVVIFEQTAEALEKRFGFRIAEYGMRWLFRRVPDHPLLAGLDEELLRDWRGAATLLPPRLTYERSQQFNFAPTVKWAGIPVTRLWRAGNRGNVGSVLVEKPARGSFLPVLDGGYSLQYTPLLEYREGQGMVLFCQVDVTGRTEAEPAAEMLAANILNYAGAWKPSPQRRVFYAGEPEGRRLLESAGFAPGEWNPNAPADGILVTGPGAPATLSPKASAIREWLSLGGRVLALGLEDAESNAFLPVQVKTVFREHIAAHFPTPGAASPFAGLSPAEVHNRDPRRIPVLTAGATLAAEGVLGYAEGGGIVFCQITPWSFDYSGEKMNIKRTFRRAACLLNGLLSNLGAASRTPLLERFSTPVREGERRWLEGFYLDIPEEWDDPYRFFRW